jgi:multiple sugar transport system permease protein
MKKRHLTPYLLILPTLIALLVFTGYPLISGIFYSFTDIKFIGGEAVWVGLANYQKLFSGGRIGIGRFFNQSFWQTILWTVSVVGGQFTLGFLTALLLNRNFRGKGIYNILILLPWTIPSVVMVLTWQWMYDPFFGLINFYLQKFGLIAKYQVWVGQPNSSIWPQVIVGIWRGIPFMTIMMLSGLKTIPKDLYEAATVDGANIIQQFFHITLPLMKKIITINLMISVMWWWNSFDIQRIMSPVGSLGYNASTLPILAWFESFQWNRLGSGAAISVISLVVLFVLLSSHIKQQMQAVKD